MFRINIDQIKKSATQWWALFLDLIFPIECVGCGAPDVWLCPTCRQSISFETKQGCPRCRTQNTFGGICGDCRAQSDLDGILIAYPYGADEVATLIKYFKYNFSLPIGKILGGMMSEFLDQFLLNQGMCRDFTISADLPKKWPRVWRHLSDAIIVPVPLHKRRLLWRGFNQAEILANCVSNNFGLNMENGLIRTKYTQPQAGLSKKKRESSVASNCFSWQGSDLTGKRIILIDDVAATGTTLNACAGTLKKAGASQVWGLVIARG